MNGRFNKNNVIRSLQTFASGNQFKTEFVEHDGLLFFNIVDDIIQTSFCIKDKTRVADEIIYYISARGKNIQKPQNSTETVIQLFNLLIDNMERKEVLKFLNVGGGKYEV